MQQFVGEDFDGVISGVSTFGFWVETVEHKCEGLVSVRDLSEFDDFRHDEENYALLGLRTKKAFRMGDKIKVKVVAANLAKRQLDYQWVQDGKGLKGVKAAKTTQNKKSSKRKSEN